jgi:hypothetical protein
MISIILWTVSHRTLLTPASVSDFAATAYSFGGERPPKYPFGSEDENIRVVYVYNLPGI